MVLLGGCMEEGMVECSHCGSHGHLTGDGMGGVLLGGSFLSSLKKGVRRSKRILGPVKRIARVGSVLGVPYSGNVADALDLAGYGNLMGGLLGANLYLNANGTLNLVRLDRDRNALMNTLHPSQRTIEQKKFIKESESILKKFEKGIYNQHTKFHLGKNNKLLSNVRKPKVAGHKRLPKGSYCNANGYKNIKYAGARKRLRSCVRGLDDKSSAYHDQLGYFINSKVKPTPSKSELNYKNLVKKYHSYDLYPRSQNPRIQEIE